MSMMTPQCIFEFGKSIDVPDRKSLEDYLIKIWSQNILQNVIDDLNEGSLSEKKAQRFLSFDGNNARARNFIGFIQTETCHIEIYPKIFQKIESTNTNKKIFLHHIFYWFDYCRKWKFPFTNINLDLFNSVEFPELIVNLMGRQILNTVSNSPISLFQEVEESLVIPKGRINFNRYISRSLTNGNQHIVECDYEPLVFDNVLNRAIKYVTRILQNKAKFTETQQILNDIIFILDEVEDVPCSVNDLNTIKLNAFFVDYLPVMDVCRMVLSEQLYSNEHYEQSQWCLLFPMEYIFEDFVAGFLEINFSEWEVKYQKSEMYLVDDPHKAFQMRHDIFLTLKANREIKIIVDTKYKLRDQSFKNDPKRNIDQSDMYQMASYALKRGCEQVLLLYPNISASVNEADRFTIKSGFNNSSDKIHITVAEIPFWSMTNFSKKDMDAALYTSLNQLLSPFSH